MVSLRCKMAVKEELDNLGIVDYSIKLGQVNLRNKITKEQRIIISDRLLKLGLKLLEDKKAVLIERIKNIVIEVIHYSENERIKVNFSHFLSTELKHDYNYLANLFSETTGITIEQFLISHKIERAKELLLYNEYNLTEIAMFLDYSSVSHLSNQFKKVTGLTPTYFRELKDYRRRQTLESL